MGSTVDLYQNRRLPKQEPIDGLYTGFRPLPALSKYTLSVCELGSTTICSNEASVSPRAFETDETAISRPSPGFLPAGYCRTNDSDRRYYSTDVVRARQ